MIWDKISAKDFESLALEFAKDKYSDYTWYQTDPTNDDNHDFFYCLCEKQGWGEAKHSNNIKKRMSKEKWDPTILSGRMAGNVHHILFVTNAHIPLKYVLRAELMKKAPFEKFEYITTTLLEKWLFYKPRVFEKFFPNSDKLELLNNTKTKPKIKIHITDLKNPQNLKNSNLTFIQNKEYLLCIIVSTDSPININFRTSKNVELLPYDYIDISNIQFEIGITCIKQIIKFKNIHKTFSLIGKCNNGYEVKRILNISIIPNTELHILFEKQTQILTDITNLINSHNNSNDIFAIAAQGGNGKSYLLNQLTLNNKNKYSYYKINFTGDENQDLSALCRLYFVYNFGIEVSNKDYFEQINTYIKKNSLPFFPDEISSIYSAGFLGEKVEHTILNNIIQKNLKEFKTIRLIQNYKTYNEIIILEDIHKIDTKYYNIFKEILYHFKYETHRSFIIMSYRPHEFINSDLNEYITNNINKIFSFNMPRLEERIKSVQENFPNIELSSAIVNILKNTYNTLNFYNMLLKINSYYNSSEFNLEQVLYFLSHNNHNEDNYYCRELLNFNEQYLFLIFLIYSLPEGLTLEVVNQFLNNKSKYLYILFNKGLIIFENDSFSPSHDFYRQAFLSEYKLSKYQKTRDEVSSFLSENISFFNNKHDILNVILDFSNNFEFNYEKMAIQLIEDAYAYKEYYKVFNLIHTLKKRKLLDETTSIWNKENLWIYFIYADCLDHLGYLIESRNAFELVYEKGCDIGLENEGFILNSLAQILNIYFALLRCNDGWIMSCKFVNENPIKQYDSNDLLDAKLTALNRKFVIELSLDKYDLAIQTNNLYFDISIQNNMFDHIAYSYIDFARGIYHKDIHLAYRLMKIAYKEFKELKNQKRRELDSSIELAYLYFIIYKKEYYVLEKRSKKAYEQNLKGIYKHTLLKRSACMLVINDIDAAELLLGKLASMYNIEHENNTRSRMLYYNQMAAISFIRDDYKKQLRYEKLYEKEAKNLGNSYIIKNNKKAIKQISFNCFDNNCYKIEARIW